MRTTKPFKRTTQPHLPTGQRNVFIGHDAIRAIQYDFYFPIAVWHHPAVITFKNSIGTLSPGGTVFKGATGVWREEKESGALGSPVEEDAYIGGSWYRETRGRQQLIDLESNRMRPR